MSFLAVKQLQCLCLMWAKHWPPLFAASTASAGKPNWFIRGPNCPDARALLNMLIACGETINTKDKDKHHNKTLNTNKREPQGQKMLNVKLSPKLEKKSWEFVCLSAQTVYTGSKRSNNHLTIPLLKRVNLNIYKENTGVKWGNRKTTFSHWI